MGSKMARVLFRVGGLVFVILLVILGVQFWGKEELTNTMYQVTVEEEGKDALGEAVAVSVDNRSTDTDFSVIKNLIKKESLRAGHVVYDVLDISLLSDKVTEVQPDGSVRVGIELNQKFNTKKLSVYYLGDGASEPVKIPSYVKDGRVYFSRKHFCEFCLISEGNGLSKIGTDNGTANVAWYVKNANATTFYLSTGADLRGLQLICAGDVKFDKATGFVTSSGTQTAVQTNFSGKRIVLLNKLTMSNVAFPGIGTTTYPFMGTFDGNGYIIQNLNGGSLFADNGGAIRNIGMEAPVITGTSGYTGAVAAINNGAITNAYVYQGSVSASAGDALGIIAGYNGASATIDNVYTAGVTVTNGATSASAIVGTGYVEGNVTHAFTTINV